MKAVPGDLRRNKHRAGREKFPSVAVNGLGIAFKHKLIKPVPVRPEIGFCGVPGLIIERKGLADWRHVIQFHDSELCSRTVCFLMNDLYLHMIVGLRLSWIVCASLMDLA